MRVIILHKSKVSSFPPIVALVQSLHSLGVKVVLICGHDDVLFIQYLRQYCDAIHQHEIKVSSTRLGKIKSWWLTRFLFWRDIDKFGYQDDVLWIPTADTTLSLGIRLLRHKYVLNLFELFDQYPLYRSKLKKYGKKALIIVCPEITRAHILKVWWRLNELPFVLPNKPFENVRERNQIISHNLLQQLASLKEGKKKLAIYQGLLTGDRGLTTLCENFNSNKFVTLVLMGRDTPLLHELLQKYPNVSYIPFVNPPDHLHITSHMDIGILSYDHSSLNNIFCAPNKIWEYSGMGIPMLGNDIPGLTSVIEVHRLGRCANFSDPDEVESALNDLVINYDLYKRNTTQYFDTVDMRYLTSQLLKKISQIDGR